MPKTKLPSPAIKMPTAYQTERITHRPTPEREKELTPLLLGYLSKVIDDRRTAGDYFAVIPLEHPELIIFFSTYKMILTQLELNWCFSTAREYLISSLYIVVDTDYVKRSLTVSWHYRDIDVVGISALNMVE